MKIGGGGVGGARSTAGGAARARAPARREPYGLTMCIANQGPVREVQRAFRDCVYNAHVLTLASERTKKEIDTPPGRETLANKRYFFFPPPARRRLGAGREGALRTPSASSAKRGSQQIDNARPTSLGACSLGRRGCRPSCRRDEYAKCGARAPRLHYATNDIESLLVLGPRASCTRLLSRSFARVAGRGRCGDRGLFILCVSRPISGSCRKHNCNKQPVSCAVPTTPVRTATWPRADGTDSLCISKMYLVRAI
ncbi:hypothetical protein EVAR_64102_1 [Eumeta japonica]|uniref:Uncharacterized protein n=1 Tax=Eumeta variegata TaxID=151549 RepID=A0A4C1ZIJ5_EUMVA|nr:hypothetical protein EVAR_64102_1 [Eumeta japonica]